VSPRARIGDVGAATRQAIDRANAASLTDGERRVFACVLALVASWTRLHDRVYVGQVADCARLSERHTRDCLHRLAELAIVVWLPRRGKSVKSLLGLPPADENRNSTPGKPELDSAKTGTPGVPETEQTASEEKPTEEKAADWPRADADASREPDQAPIDPDVADALHHLVELLPDSDAKTLGVFLRDFGWLDADEIHYAINQIEKRTRRGELHQPAGYARRILENIDNGYSGP